MKAVKIDEKNQNEIAGLLEEVEGKSWVNCSSMNDLLALARRAENRLSNLEIPKKERSGAEFYNSPGGPSAFSYGGSQGATAVRIVRKSSEWYLMEVARIQVFPRQYKKNILTITKQQRDIAVAKFCQGFEVK